MLKLLPWAGYTEAEITALEPGRRLAWKAAFPLTMGGYWMKADLERGLSMHFAEYESEIVGHVALFMARK